MSQTVTFREMYDMWHETVLLHKSIKPLSLARYEKCEPRIMERFGDMNINEITHRQIQVFVNELSKSGNYFDPSKGLSSKSQRLHISVMSNVFHLAILEGYIESNPAIGVRTTVTEKKERDVYEIEEVQQILNLLQNEPMKYRVFYTVAAFTGFRRGELLGLKWENINFERNTISVVSTRLEDVYNGGSMEGTTKTDGSRRTVTVSDVVMDLLREYKKYKENEAKKFGPEWIETDLLFTAKNGSPMGVNSALHWYEGFCERNNIRYLCTHCFRHFAASVMIDSGMDVVKVSAALGHSKPTTTLGIYAHEFSKANAHSCEVIGNALKINQKEKDN